LLVLLTASAASVDLRSHGRLAITASPEWKVSSENLGDRHEVTIEPRGDVNAMCRLTVVFPEKDELNTKARLRDQVLQGCQQHVENSVEKKAVAKEFSVRRGFGYYCSFTDPELVGKPPEKGNYKVMSLGLIRLAKDVYVTVTVFADGFKTEAYQQLLGAVERMDLTTLEDEKPI
jgi:hypothetical protein